MNNSGVYWIKNIINNKVYIGSTISFSKRKSQHLSELRNNKHRNIYLQRSFNKYGNNNFIFEILEFVNNIDNLLVREQDWIDFYKNRNKLINVNFKANAKYGFRHKQETKEKLRNISLGRKHSSKDIEKMRIIASKYCKPVVQLDKDTCELICQYKSLSEAAKALNTTKSLIRNACKSKSSYAKGYIWKFLSEYNNIVEITPYKRTVSKDHAKNANMFAMEKIRKPVLQLDINTLEVVAIYTCISDAIKINNCNKIQRYCKTNKPVCGYIWFLMEEYENLFE